jgi:alpha-beta hydrolase superfamily lysophospholipase
VPEIRGTKTRRLLKPAHISAKNPQYRGRHATAQNAAKKYTTIHKGIGMNTETQFFEASDGAKIALYSMNPDIPVRAVILICHGMMEHAKRYEYTAKAFAQRGFAVFAYDQRGHGETAGTLEQAGYIADGDGFARVVQDLHEIHAYVTKLFPGKKNILLGHSFGSFVSQSFIEQYGSETDACVLSGTAGPRPVFLRAGLLVVRAVYALKGGRYRSKFVDAMTFGSYNKKAENSESSFDWLTRDRDEIQKHDADPWCTFLPTTGFFRDLVSGLVRIHKSKAIAAIPAGLPVLLFSGTGDPVGGYGKTVQNLAHRYKKNGMTDVTVTLYPEGRHEMLHEINKDEVIADVLAWMEKRTE